MRTAAETKDVARATRRRRRILQAGFFFMLVYLTIMLISCAYYAKIYKIV